MNITQQVMNAICRIYDITATYEYPGYIAIPESVICEDTDGSDNVWCVGPDSDGDWSGQLMNAKGVNINGESFVVRPDSNDHEVIASAIYCHGIGDRYLGGGCSDVDCPCRPIRSPSAQHGLECADAGRTEAGAAIRAARH